MIFDSKTAPKTTPNRPKRLPREVFFRLRFRLRFWIDFGSILAPKTPPPKSLCTPPCRLLVRVLFLDCFWDAKMTLQDPLRGAKMIPPDTQNDHPSGQNDPQDGPKRPQEAPRQAQEASRGAKTLPSPNCKMKIPKKAFVSQNLKSHSP